MKPLITFACGFCGSLAAEIVNVVQQYEERGDDHLPLRYKSPWFWFWRILLAIVGGGLALAYGIEGNPLLAANVGVSTPLIIKSLAQGVKRGDTKAIE